MIFNPNTMPATGGGGAIIGSYVGDGTTALTLEFEVEPALVLIHNTNANQFGNVVLFTANANGYGVRIKGSANPANMTGHISGKTLTVTDPGHFLTEQNQTFTYLIIPKA